METLVHCCSGRDYQTEVVFYRVLWVHSISLEFRTTQLETRPLYPTENPYHQEINSTIPTRTYLFSTLDKVLQSTLRFSSTSTTNCNSTCTSRTWVLNVHLLPNVWNSYLLCGETNFLSCPIYFPSRREVFGSRFIERAAVRCHSWRNYRKLWLISQTKYNWRI